MCSFLEPSESLSLDIFVPILIVPYAFKELHQVHIFTHLLRLVEHGRPLDIYLPIKFFNALPYFFFGDANNHFTIFDPGQILNNWLIIVDFSFVHNHFVLGKVGVFQMEKVSSISISKYLNICVPITGEESLLTMPSNSSAESEGVNYW